MCCRASAREESSVAQLVITYWKDIPAQVSVKRRREVARRELPLRFTEAIDMCAMRVGARDSDAYMAEWRRGEPTEVGEDLETEADRALADVETVYDDERLKALVRNGGTET